MSTVSMLIEIYCPHCGHLISDTRAEEGTCPLCQSPLSQPASKTADAQRGTDSPVIASMGFFFCKKPNISILVRQQYCQGHNYQIGVA